MNKNVFSNSVEKVNTIENLYKYIFVLKICSVYFLRAVLYEHILVLHQDSGFIFELSLQKKFFFDIFTDSTSVPIPKLQMWKTRKRKKVFLRKKVLPMSKNHYSSWISL